MKRARLAAGVLALAAVAAATPAAAVSILDLTGIPEGVETFDRTLTGGEFDGVTATFSNPNKGPFAANFSNNVSLQIGQFAAAIRSFDVVLDGDATLSGARANFLGAFGGFDVLEPSGATLAEDVFGGFTDFPAAIVDLTTPTALQGNVTYTVVAGGNSGNFFEWRFESPQPIPLPAGALLLVSGLAALGLRARRG